MGSTDSRLWALVEGHANATAYGEMQWMSYASDSRSRVPVAADHFEQDQLELEMRVSPGRPCEPNVVLLALGECVRRVDVNSVHRIDGVPYRQSHLQGQPPPDYLVWLDDKALPPLSGSGIVDGEEYRRLFRAAAKLMHVDTTSVDWNDPPGGS